MNNEEKRAYDREWYAKNKERIRESKNKRVQNKRQSNAMYVYNYLLSHPCVDCGESDPIVLEFDHTKDKHKSMSDMVRQSYSIDKIKNEIEKCEVRCANCHRRKTDR